MVLKGVFRYVEVEGVSDRVNLRINGRGLDQMKDMYVSEAEE